MLGFIIVPAQLVSGAAHLKVAMSDPDHLQIHTFGQRDSDIRSITQHHTEAHIVPILNGGIAVSAIRGSAVLRCLVPVAAAQDTVFPHTRSHRIHRNSERIIIFIPVPAPFPHIPVHIVQPPGIRQLLPHLMSRVIAIVLIPSHFIHFRTFVHIRQIFPAVQCRFRPGPAGIFPLSLRGKRIAIALRQTAG